MDSFWRLILPDFFRIGVNGCQRFGRRSVTTLRLRFRPFEGLRAVSASNRFMAQTALKPHLMLDDDNSMD